MHVHLECTNSEVLLCIREIRAFVRPDGRKSQGNGVPVLFGLRTRRGTPHTLYGIQRRTAFFCNQLSSERTEYNISCDIHLLNGRKKLLVHQTATPILIGRDGMPLFSLCIMKHSVMHEIGNITVKRKGHRAFYKYDMDKANGSRMGGLY